MRKHLFRWLFTESERVMIQYSLHYRAKKYRQTKNPKMEKVCNELALKIGKWKKKKKSDK